MVLALRRQSAVAQGVCRSTYPSFRGGRFTSSGPFNFVILSVYQEWYLTSFSDHRWMILAISRVIPFKLLGRIVDGGEERTNSIRTGCRGTQRVNTGSPFAYSAVQAALHFDTF